jgi:hypothetical protein
MTTDKRFKRALLFVLTVEPVPEIRTAG